jgi:hypothetical protein
VELLFSAASPGGDTLWRLVPEFDEEFDLLCDFVWRRRRRWEIGVAKSDQELRIVSKPEQADRFITVQKAAR